MLEQLKKLSALKKVTMIGKIKEFIDELKDMIDWILAGMPEPIPIPITEDGNDGNKTKPKNR